MVVQPEGPCLRCLLPAPPAPGASGTCETEGVLQPAVAAVAAFQAAESIKILARGAAAAARGVFDADVWAGSYGVRMTAAAPNPDCPTCQRHTYPALRDPPTEPARLCGRDAVQIRPAAAAVALPELAARLDGAVTGLEVTPHLLRFAADGCRFSVFPGGRALVFGTADPVRARVLYERYVGG